MENAIEVENLTKTFGNFRAINNLSFSIKKNKILGFLGSNGAGKTTCINIISGILSQDSGKVTILGKDNKKDIEKIRKEIAIVPQTISLYDNLTIYENLEFFGSLYIKDNKELEETIFQVLEILKLEEKINVRISRLSGGYQRRCSIGCALLAKPKILILDEPLTGIDLNTVEFLMKFIKSLEDTTVIFTTHSIKEAEAICDNILFMHKGEKILEGTPDEIKKKFSKTLGEKIIIEINNPNKINIEKIKTTLENKFEIKNFKLENNKIHFESFEIGKNIIEIIEELDEIKSDIINIDIKKPSLEDVFLNVIGGKL